MGTEGLTKLERQLFEALEDLVGEQNGPPLLRHEADWLNAMHMARGALKAVEKKKEEEKCNFWMEIARGYIDLRERMQARLKEQGGK